MTQLCNKYIVGNKAKGCESQNGCLKRVFKEIKARQIFRKTNISYSLIRTRMCSYQGIRNVRFSGTWRALFSLKTRFEIHPFALRPTKFQLDWIKDFIDFERFSSPFINFH